MISARITARKVRVGIKLEPHRAVKLGRESWWVLIELEAANKRHEPGVSTGNCAPEDHQLIVDPLPGFRL